MRINIEWSIERKTLFFENVFYIILSRYKQHFTKKIIFKWQRTFLISYPKAKCCRINPMYKTIKIKSWTSSLRVITNKYSKINDLSKTNNILQKDKIWN